MKAAHADTRLRILLLATGSLLLVAGCSNSTSPISASFASSDKQVLRVNIVGGPGSLDPGQQTSAQEAVIGRNIFEPLLKPRPDLSDVQPAAARSYEVSSDGLTYTFHLQPSGSWSDGRPVAAADFVYGWQRLLNPALTAGYADPFFTTTVAGASGYGRVDPSDAHAIDIFLAGLGLTAPDPETFVVRLQRPVPYFKWVASLWVAAPIRKDVVEKAAGGVLASNDATKAEKWAVDQPSIIGNGPFVITEIQPQDHLTLAPNKRYWSGPGRIQRLIFDFIRDGATAFNEYKTGSIEQIQVPDAEVTAVLDDPVLSRQAYLRPALQTFWVSFNTRRPPFDNSKVRLAFAKSIDRNKLVDYVLHGGGKALSSFIPQGMSGYDASDGAEAYDLAAARADLASAGITASGLGILKLLTKDNPLGKIINQFIVEQWKSSLGLDVQLEILDSKTVVSRLKKGDFELYGPDGWGADYPDQQDWLDIFTTTSCHSLNWGCPALAGYDALVEQADLDLNAARRDAEYLKAQKILIDEGAVGFLYQVYERDLIAPYVHLTTTPLDDFPGDFYYHDAYLTQH